MDRTIYTVSQVNAYVQSMMEQDALLSGLCVQGELSNYKVYPSGHHYFSLKDAGGALRCVMFKSSALRLRFRPENGMRVVAFGRVSVYPRDGQYQLYCTGLMADGVGDLHMVFERMKERLAAKGYFDPARKQPIPKFPERIAIITSPAGAAVHDMLRILKKRYPIVSVRIIPVRVQGAEAPGEIADAIDYVNRRGLADLIITGRGGGSIEDLWAFNEEIVAQAIFRSKIPVISAVGHEPDVTISDYVADLRAATPSNAAEMAVQDRQELNKRMLTILSLLRAGLTKQIRSARQRLDLLASARPMSSPTAAIDDKRQFLDNLHRRLCDGMKHRIGADGRRYAQLAAALDAMSPLKVLCRGYAIAQTGEGEIVRSIGQVKTADSVHVRLSDGSFTAKIDEIVRSKEDENLG